MIVAVMPIFFILFPVSKEEPICECNKMKQAKISITATTLPSVLSITPIKEPAIMANTSPNKNVANPLRYTFTRYVMSTCFILLLA